MRKAATFLLMLGWLWLPVKGQLARIDTLRSVLSITPPNDPEYVSLLIEFGDALFRFDPEAAYKPVNRAIRFSDSLKKKLESAQGLVLRSRINFIRGNYRNARVDAEKAVALFKKVRNGEGQVEAGNALGNVYRQTGDYQQALNHFLEANQIADSIKFKALTGELNNNIGRLQLLLGEKEKAENLAEDALAWAKKNSDPLAESDALILKGIIQIENDSLDLAEEKLLESLLIKQRNGDLVGQSYTAVNLGEVFLRKKDKEESASFFRQALKISNETGYKGGQVLALTAMGRWGVTFQEYDSAQIYLNRAQTLAKSIGEKDQEALGYALISDLNMKLGNFQAALKNYKQFTTLREELSDRQKSLMLADLQTKYDAASNEKDNLELQEKQREQAARIRFQNILTVAIGAGLFLVLMIALTLFRSNRRSQSAARLLEKKNLEIEQQKKELEQKNETLEDLNREKDSLTGIVAHDLKSPLNKMQGLTQLVSVSGELNEEQDNLLVMMDKVAKDGIKLIRDLLDVSAAENEGSKVNKRLLNLNQFVQDYVKEAVHEAKNKDIQLHFEQRVNRIVFKSDPDFLTRILDNIVSNAIKFSERGSNIYLTADKEEKAAWFSVRDEGPGISEADQKKMFKKFQKLSARPTGGESSTGLGLSIIKALVDKLGGRIDVKSELGVGTEFIIHLPLREPATAD